MPQRIMIISLLLLFLLAPSTQGGIPHVINYQGKVTDSVGAPIPDGTYTMRFQIYDQLIGGSPLWDSGNQNIDVSNCIFNIMLGSTGQPDIDLAFDTDYWLLISFDG